MAGIAQNIERLIQPPEVRGQFHWALGLGALIVLATIVFHDGTLHLLREWRQPEFSHGPFIPLISLYLIWRSRFQIVHANHDGQQTGLAFIAFGLLCLFLGEFSTVYSLLEFGFIVTTIGLAYCFIGHGGIALTIGPLIHLFLMMPVPDLIYNSVSQKLQLISSALGVSFIRLFNIPVFLEGNMIDLGAMNLQVAEACNGLRYAYPLTSIAYIIAFSFKGPLWKKLAIIGSAIPLAILMNALRIGATGLLVDQFGLAAAEGFLHYFEGWVVFLLCLVVLFSVVALLGMVFGPHKAFLDCLAVDPPARMDAPPKEKWLPFWTNSAAIAGAVLVIAGLTVQFFPERTEKLPSRLPLVMVPDQLGAWRGRDTALDPAVLRSLRLTDYKLTNYSRAPTLPPVQLYVSYYASQRKGAAVHSPAACIPAGGWEIDSLSRAALPGMGREGTDLHVNRVLISKGTQRQLVYYWFDQRGQTLTSAFQVKTLIFWDALTKGRTDGAMIRLSVDIPRGRTVAQAEARLKDFARHAYPTLSASLPK